MRFFILLLSSLLASFSILLAQEQCSDGIDNDGDGFIDCYDSDCSGNMQCTDFYFGNIVGCQNPASQNLEFNADLKWASPEGSSSVSSLPSIGDIDGDGLPELVVTNTIAQTLTLLDGKTGYIEEGPISVGFEPSNTTAIANLNNDDCASIFIKSHEGTAQISAYDCKLNEVWTESTSTQRIGLLSLVDFNADGIVELLHGNEIRNAHTGSLLLAGNGDFNETVSYGSIAIDILEEDECTDCSGAEIIEGGKIYAVNSSGNTWTKTLVKDINETLSNDTPYAIKGTGVNQNSVSVADYNNDGYIDVFISGGQAIDAAVLTTVFFWDVKNNAVTTFEIPDNPENGTGRIAIADMNGNGLSNSTFISGNTLYVLDEKMELLLEKTVNTSIGYTGVSSFDFNGNGYNEIIYRNEEGLFILDVGLDETSTKIDCKSTALDEYPIIIDIDGDGSTEICVSCAKDNNLDLEETSNTQYGQIRVYKADQGESWQPTRSVWNQHAYYNVNINDDLSIPIVQQNASKPFSTNICTLGPTRPLNNFMSQTTFLDVNGCPSFVSPDVELISIEWLGHNSCITNSGSVMLVIENSGDYPLSGNLPVTFYNGSPFEEGTSKLNTVYTSIHRLGVDQQMEFTTYVEGVDNGEQLYVLVNEDGISTPPLSSISSGLNECDDGNNILSLSITNSTFSIAHQVINHDLSCSTEGSENEESGEVKIYLTGTSPNAGLPIWDEDFSDLTYGNEEDTGETAWYFSTKPSGAERLAITSDGMSNSIVFSNTGSEAVWETEVIDISTYDIVNMSVNLRSSSNLEEDKDSFSIAYILDQGDEVLLSNGNYFGSIGAAIASAQGIEGNSLKIVARALNNSNDKLYFIDQVTIEGFQLESNDSEITFSWYEDENLSTPIFQGQHVTGIGAGTYTVIASSDESCTSNQHTVVVKATSEDLALIKSDNSDPLDFNKCEDGSLVLSIEGTYTSYSWEGKTDTQTSFSTIGTSSEVTINEEQTIRVNLIASNGCSITTTEVSITNAEKSTIGISAIGYEITNDATHGKTIALQNNERTVELSLTGAASNITWSADDNILGDVSSIDGHRINVPIVMEDQEIKVSYENIYGCLEQDSLTITGYVLDIKPITNTLIVYPNPVTGGLININSASKVLDIQLIDVSGKLMLSENPNDFSFEIDFESISQGIYILVIKTDTGEIQRRVIVQ